MKTLCPNCMEPIEGHPQNGCVVAALMQVLRERDEHSEEELKQLHTDINPDALWEVLGKVVDTIGEGGFNCEPE